MGNCKRNKDLLVCLPPRVWCWRSPRYLPELKLCLSNSSASIGYLPRRANQIMTKMIIISYSPRVELTELAWKYLKSWIDLVNKSEDVRHFLICWISCIQPNSDFSFLSGANTNFDNDKYIIFSPENTYDCAFYFEDMECCEGKSFLIDGDHENANFIVLKVF